MRPYVINPPYFTLLEMCLRKVAHYHRCILIAVEEARLANLPPPVYQNEGGGIKYDHDNFIRARTRSRPLNTGRMIFPSQPKIHYTANSVWLRS